MKLAAVVIEDESKLREVFIQLVKENCPEIQIIGEAGNITDGYNLIINKRPDVVFLDIEMPGGNGFELLSRFETFFFETIFVSSYGHYAIRAIKLSALDYLLKPVLIEDLKKVPQRLKQAIELKESALKYKMLRSNLKANERDKKIALQTQNKLEQITTTDIVYLKAEGNYTHLYLKDGSHKLVAKTLKDFEDLLCEEENAIFMRIHKTYILNILQIKTIERGEGCFVLLVNGTRIEVSRRKKTSLMEKFKILNQIPFMS